MGAECENAYAVETHASSHRRGGPFTLTFRAEPGAILEVFDLIGGRTRTRTLDPLIKSFIQVRNLSPWRDTDLAALPL